MIYFNACVLIIFHYQQSLNTDLVFSTLANKSQAFLHIAAHITYKPIHPRNLYYQISKNKNSINKFVDCTTAIHKHLHSCQLMHLQKHVTLSMFPLLVMAIVNNYGYPPNSQWSPHKMPAITNQIVRRCLQRTDA